jgi:hypothetical protein
MKTHFGLASSVAFAFVVAAGLGVRDQEGVPKLVFPAPAYAAASCAVAALVCANDSSPGCETICGGEQQAVCEEGTCSPGGNVVTPNRCSCK